MVKSMNDFYGSRTDLIFEKRQHGTNFLNKNLEILCYKENNFDYHFIYFRNLNSEDTIKETLKKEIRFFLNLFSISNPCHFFIVGLGNESNTADSVGPKTLKHLKVNAYLDTLGIPSDNNRLSSLEPGVLGETGIETSRIIESVVSEIKPNMIILIDSYVSENIQYLNKTIQLTNEGIIPGSGLKNWHTEISTNSIGIPTLVIGVPTAIELTFDQNKNKNLYPYILSSKDIDSYVLKISKIIGEALNEVLLTFGLS